MHDPAVFLNIKNKHTALFPKNGGKRHQKRKLVFVLRKRIDGNTPCLRHDLPAVHKQLYLASDLLQYGIHDIVCALEFLNKAHPILHPRLHLFLSHLINQADNRLRALFCKLLCLLRTAGAHDNVIPPGILRDLLYACKKMQLKPLHFLQKQMPGQPAAVVIITDIERQSDSLHSF